MQRSDSNAAVRPQPQLRRRTLAESAGPRVLRLLALVAWAITLGLAVFGKAVHITCVAASVACWWSYVSGRVDEYDALLDAAVEDAPGSGGER